MCLTRRLRVEMGDARGDWVSPPVAPHRVRPACRRKGRRGLVELTAAEGGAVALNDRSQMSSDEEVSV